MMYRILAAALSVAALCQMAHAESVAIELSKHRDWRVLQSTGSTPKLCFVASQPIRKEPAGANRSAALLYVSTWPAEGVKSEVSIKLGYPIKTGSAVTVAVDDKTYSLFSKSDRAFVKDATLELKLIEAMKKGRRLVVQATSQRGTQTRDTYSLSGFTRAYKSLFTACPS